MALDSSGFFLFKVCTAADDLFNQPDELLTFQQMRLWIYVHLQVSR